MTPFATKRSPLARWPPLLALLLAGFALRVYRAGHQEIWGDEGAKLEVVNQGLGHLFWPGAEVHPRFFHTWLFLWYQIFGYNVFGLRMLVVLFGMLGLPLIYVLARRVFVRQARLEARPGGQAPPSSHRAGQTASLAALLILVVSPFHVAYSQDLTMYSLLFAMVTLSSYTLLRALDANGPRAWRAWAAYAGVTLLMMHTHYYAAFAVAAQAVYVLMCHRRALAAWAGAQAVVAAGFLPWLYLHYHLLAGQTVNHTEHLSLSNFAFILSQAALGFTVGATFPERWAWLGWLYILLVLAALVILLARRSTRDTGALLGLWLLVPPLLVWGFDVLLQHFGERFVSMSLPPLALLLGWGISRVPWRRAGPTLVAAAYVLTSLVALRAWYFDPAFLKSRYGEMIALIGQRAQPGDVLLLDGPEQAILFHIYHPAGLDYSFVSPDTVDTDAATARDLPGLVAGHSRAWLVLFGAPATYDPAHRAEAWLAGNGYKAFYQSYQGSYVTLYVLGSAQPPLQPVDLQFTGGPHLTGFAYASPVLHAGDTLLVTLQWRATAPMTIDYTVFTHLWDATGQLVAQLDSQPASGTRPTSSWAPGEVVIDRRALLVPADVPPGDYSLQIGVYDLATSQRLSVTQPGGPQDGFDHVNLGTVQITP
jgi:4-amino-4-deoxy-L-arabinose transferase-like glycosyltransferase